MPKGFESEWDGKQLFRLGKTLAEAYCMWADRIATIDDAKTIAELLDRHALGAVPLLGLKPRHVYKYIDKRAARSPAPRSRDLVSCVPEGCRLGYLDRPPFKGEVRLDGEMPLTRYVEDWEIVECLSVESRRKAGSVLAIQAYMRANPTDWKTLREGWRRDGDSNPG